MRKHVYSQYLFFHQWERLKAYAARQGIRIIGDAPIFVAHDSADCWAHRELFYLEPNGQPSLVAGVPPDYFAATGQRWGNPLYRWDAMAADGYAWWIERLRTVLTTVDVLRLDHFRGFAGYWAIPGAAPTAETGTWEPGPGIPFAAVEKALGRLLSSPRIWASLRPTWSTLRDHFNLPGMKVLQFAFDAFEDPPNNPHLPHNYAHNCVVYTGTHDNDTAAGWFASARPGRGTCRPTPPRMGWTPAWDLTRLAAASVADTAIVPLQDLLGFGPPGAHERARPTGRQLAMALYGGHVNGCVGDEDAARPPRWTHTRGLARREASYVGRNDDSAGICVEVSLRRAALIPNAASAAPTQLRAG